MRESPREDGSSGLFGTLTTLAIIIVVTGVAGWFISLNFDAEDFSYLYRKLSGTNPFPDH